MTQPQSETISPPENFPVTWDAADAQRSWERDAMHFPHALTPLAGDYVGDAIVSGFNYRLERHQLPLRIHGRIVNGYVYLSDEMLFAPAEREQAMQLMQQARRTQASVLRAYWDHKVMPTLQSAYQWMRETPNESCSLMELAEQWDQLWQHIRHIYGLHFMCNSGSYTALNQLADLYESFTPDAKPSDALVLVQGLDRELQQVQSDLHQLTMQARALPAVAAHIGDHRDTTMDDVRRVEGGAQFVDALQTFLNKHGHLGQAFEDVYEPSWADEPARVIVEVRKRLLHRSADPAALRQRLIAEGDALAAQTRARLQDQPELLQKFEEALALARDVGPLTEDHNYWIDRMLHAHARRFMLSVSKRMSAEGMLAAADDIFFLHRSEVAEALRAPRDLRALISAHRSDHARWQTLQPPAWLGQPPRNEPVSNRFANPVNLENTAELLRGVGACKGVARGPARVVLTLNDFAKVQPNDILVCPASNPTWIPLFGIIAGLVTDTGGVLSHAAVVSREFGVPSVVGTGNATQLIRDGQLIEVDGSAGMVRMLEGEAKTADRR